MANQTKYPSPANDTGISRKRSPIDLHIQSPELFLSGRFHRWQSAVSLGDDLDELAVKLAVDVTSPDHLNAVHEGDELLSFRSELVVPLRENVSVARGQLDTAAGSTPFEMVVETPTGHTAFLGLSFLARKEQLGAKWKELVTGAGAGGIDAERLLDPWSVVNNPDIAVS